jgi:hypothetical protein
VTPRVEIEIGELVVRGLAPVDARAAASALEARLAVLAARPGRPPAARAEASRRLGAIEVRDRGPAAVGEAVAGAVWAAVAPGRRGR